MADIDNTAQFMEGAIDDAFVPPSLKFDFIYGYMTNVDWKYLAQIPSFKQPAYHLKRTWLCAANGFVPEWHYNFISTKLGNALISNINRKIFSGSIQYERDKNAGEVTDQQREWFAEKYIEDDEVDFEGAFSRASWNRMASGDAYLVAKKNRNGKLYFDAYREDKVLPTFAGRKLQSIRLYSMEFNSLDGQGVPDIYCLEDYRFFHNNRAYSIIRAFRKDNGELNSIVNNSVSGLCYEDMPEEVAKSIREKVGDRLNKVCPLPFFGGTSLGVAHLRNTTQSAYFDMPNYSDSILAPVLEQLFEYDRTYTTMINDIALGRGQVLIPDTMDLGLSGISHDSNLSLIAAAISQQNTLNSKVFRKVPVSNPESIKPNSIQFEMRIEEHLASLRGQRINICNNIGINPGALDPTLAESGPQKTAVQVMTDEQNLVTFVEEKRKGLLKAMQWAADLVMAYYFGTKDSGLHPKFSTGNLTNAIQLSQMVRDEYTAGIRSLDDAVQRINPNASKDEVEAEVDKIRKERTTSDFPDGGQNYFGL